jgi:hypothetical protein
MVAMINNFFTKRYKIGEERMKVCEGCEHFTSNFCKKCGCFLPAKTLLPNSECPLGKWGPYKEVDKEQSK